jgi:hypothetical protein
MSNSLDGSDDIFVPQHDEVSNQSFASVDRKHSIVIEQQARQLTRKVCRLLWIACSDL